ncbi:hypothetical protein McanMca71_000338 [Microsporum canis]|uniref:RNA helicase HEL117 n=1 Tax=Arthroderma otae (strain ATCC MYA-4605 / CBS 113480) TaxID=554155 RepID=C5FDP9_ARTOC|nr:conserved hypothetical protein [Microsporum canis CBS 113480]EEQ27845.1 conserved hypothetical protein [Microsporum canis CBS 113480]
MSLREVSVSPRDHHRHRRRHHDHDHHSASIRADTRSRSPVRESSYDNRRQYRRSRREDNRSTHRRQRSSEALPVILPFGATALSKRDLPGYKAMFGTYLDIQKGIYIDELDERELRGRWKSFIGKWNRGELAEGWYDPATFKKAVEGAYNRDSPKASGHRAYGRRSSPTYMNDEKSSSSLNETHSRLDDGRLSIERDDDDEEDSYGPQAPVPHHQSLSRKSGPKIPTMADLTLKREDEQLDLEESRRVNRAARKQELNAHKSELRKIEDEIAPRAEPGSRERLLEKKREKSASNRAYAEARGGSPVDGVADADLMGGAEGEDGFKQMKEKQMRKKNERELRKEEILRARAEEREVRLRSYRRKEDETMDYLRAIAQERFG